MLCNSTLHNSWRKILTDFVLGSEWHDEMQHDLLLGELLDDGQLLLDKVELLSLAGASSLLDEDLVEASIEVVDSSEEVEESISLLAEDGLVVQESGKVNHPSTENIDRPSRYGCVFGE
jgi:hypothetical protein